MATTSIKGHEIPLMAIRDSHGRKAQQFRNNIILALGKIGLTEDDIDIVLEPIASKKLPAFASWYLEGYHLHYSYSASSNFASNLCVVFKVIEAEVKALLDGKKTIQEFIADFSEEKEIIQTRIEAREILGVPPDCVDMALIDKAYKALAKEAHPDMSTGSVERFKRINNAHKVLKRELT